MAQASRQTLKLALVRARNLFWTLDRAAEAELVLRNAEAALAANGPRGAAELHALRARFAFAQGDPRAALAIAAPVEASGEAPEAARVQAALAMAEAFAVCGRRDDAVAVARRWEAGSQRRLLRAQGLAHWLAGSLAEATDAAERAYAAASDPQGSATCALLLGHVWLSREEVDTALRWFREPPGPGPGLSPTRLRALELLEHRVEARLVGAGERARAGCRRPSSSRSRCPWRRRRPPRGRGRTRRGS